MPTPTQKMKRGISHAKKILKRSYLLFPRTLNVPPDGGEKYMIIACIISHMAAQMKLYMLIACIFSTIDAYRRVGGGEAAANSSVCMVFDAISKNIHAISMYFSPPWGGTFNVLGNIR